MKICVAGELAGGVGVYTQNLVRGLMGLGHHVTVVTPQAAASPSAETIAVPEVRGRGRFVRQALHLARGLRSAGAKHDVVHVTDARYAAFVGDSVKPAALVGTMNDDFYCGTRWLDINATRDIYEDWPLRHVYYNILREGERFAIRHMTRIICVSSEVRDSVVDHHGVSLDRLDVVHYGLEFPEPEPMDLGHEDRAEPLVLFAGGNFQRKGLGVLIEAAPDVIQRIPDVRFIVVGNSRDEARMRNRARSLLVSDHFEFIGQTSLERLHSLYKRSSVFAMPSKRESFGIPYLEAMHHGIPVVASDTRGPSDFLRNGVNALCPPAGQSRPLTEAILSALTDSKLRSRLIAGGKATVAEFTRERMATETSAVYVEAVKGKNA